MDINALRVGDIFLGGTPAEAYPEIATELQARVLAGPVCGDNRHVFTLSLTNDQVGYTPTTDEYAVAVRDGGDEGLFTLNQVVGNNMINHQLANARTLGFATGPDYTRVQPILPPQPPYGPSPDLADASGPAPNCALGTTTALDRAEPPTGSGLPVTGRTRLPPLAIAVLVAATLLVTTALVLLVRPRQQS